jgi:nitrate reductase gamma subunit
MRVLAEETVKWAALGKEAIVAFVGGVGAVAAFGLVVLGSSRASQERERGGSTAAPVFGAAVGALNCVAALVIGFIAMTHKSS